MRKTHVTKGLTAEPDTNANSFVEIYQSYYLHRMNKNYCLGNHHGMYQFAPWFSRYNRSFVGTAMNRQSVIFRISDT